MGYPIVDVELQDINFFTCLEEAANEYSSQVNQYRAKENLLSLQEMLLLQKRNPNYFDEICQQKKFSFSQKVTLKKYLTQWQSRFPMRNPLGEIGQEMTASQILKKFSDNLSR